MSDCCVGAAYAETGQIPVALARVVRAVTQVRCHRQMVRFNRQRQLAQCLADSVRSLYIPGNSFVTAIVREKLILDIYVVFFLVLVERIIVGSKL